MSILIALLVQTLMLSRALRADFSQCYGDIQRKVNEEHERNNELSAKVKVLEAQLAEAEAGRSKLREELKEQKSARTLLEEEVEAERALSTNFGLSAWKAMEILEDGLSMLGAVPPPRHHRPSEPDITLERLRLGCETCVPAARTYGDHCAKVAWLATLASLDKAGCAHLDALATGSTKVATAEEVCAAQRRIRKASKVLQHDFWGQRGHDAAEESFKAVQAQQAKGKSRAEDAEASKRGSTRADKV